MSAFTSFNSLTAWELRLRNTKKHMMAKKGRLLMCFGKNIFSVYKKERKKNPIFLYIRFWFVHSDPWSRTFDRFDGKYSKYFQRILIDFRSSRAIHLLTSDRIALNRHISKDGQSIPDFPLKLWRKAIWMGRARVAY